MLCPPVGARVHHGVLSDMRRDLRHALRRGAVAACLILGRGVKVAARSSATVGTDLTGVVLPRPAHGREWRLSAPPVWLARREEGPMAFELDASEHEFRWRLPTMAFEGCVVLGSEVQGAGSELRSVEAEFTRPPPGTKVGIGLKGSVSGKEVVFGIDEKLGNRLSKRWTLPRPGNARGPTGSPRVNAEGASPSS